MNHQWLEEAEEKEGDGSPLQRTSHRAAAASSSSNATDHLQRNLDRLAAVKRALDDGLITDDEAKSKRKRIVDEM